MIKVNGLSVSRIPINGKETLRVMCNGQQLWSGSGLPAGYTLLEYIESKTRSAYIDTGFIPNNNTRVILDAEVPDSSSAVYVMGVNDWTSGKYYQIRVTSSGTSYISDYGAGWLDSDVNASGRFIFDKNKNICKIGNTEVINTESTFVCNTNLKLLAGVTTSGNHSACAGKIYSCQIFDNDNLVRDYIPCMNPEGICGLFDKVNRVFYQSATSTPFTGA